MSEIITIFNIKLNPVIHAKTFMSGFLKSLSNHDITNYDSLTSCMYIFDLVENVKRKVLNTEDFFIENALKSFYSKLGSEEFTKSFFETNWVEDIKSEIKLLLSSGYLITKLINYSKNSYDSIDSDSETVKQLFLQTLIQIYSFNDKQTVKDRNDYAIECSYLYFEFGRILSNFFLLEVFNVSESIVNSFLEISKTSKQFVKIFEHHLCKLALASLYKKDLIYRSKFEFAICRT